MKIEVSNGEIADKLTIIEIKRERITDKAKLANLAKEYNELNEAIEKVIDKKHPLYEQLYEINQQLWDIEDHIRDLERKKEFNKDFIETSRSVYFTNDKRSEIKRKINELTGSALIEEKSYKAY
jgi:hypothetical protein